MASDDDRFGTYVSGNDAKKVGEAPSTMEGVLGFVFSKWGVAAEVGAIYMELIRRGVVPPPPFI
jgi:hypothetical protein